MALLARQTSIVLVALAVMLAGLCCRSGVCLAGMMSMPSAASMMSADSGGNVPPCCALHQSGKPFPAEGQKCPLCRQVLVLGKGVDQDHGGAVAMAAVDFALPPIELLPVVSGNCFRRTDARDLPAQLPHTLLGLHCALIG